jgi:hypothetical protein
VHRIGCNVVTGGRAESNNHGQRSEFLHCVTARQPELGSLVLSAAPPTRIKAAREPMAPATNDEHYHPMFKWQDCAIDPRQPLCMLCVVYRSEEEERTAALCVDRTPRRQ